MDEGGFILDYDTPPGSSLAKPIASFNTSKDLHSVPEVETLRAARLQLALLPLPKPTGVILPSGLNATAAALSTKSSLTSGASRTDGTRHKK